MKKLTVAMIGCGRFASFFVPLFKLHPEVEKVYVCDLIEERARDYSEKFSVPIIESFEAALKSSEVNAIAIFTQRFAHGPMAIKALKAGKHVYSSVPCAISIDDIREIERLVRETGLTYSMGETGCYRAATMFCREHFSKGDFGQFTYAEAQYNHDIRNMEASFRSSGGDRWREYAGIPPMFYPTHSTSMILSAMSGVYAKTVTAQSFVSPNTDIYGTDGQNLYDNPFGNTAMLLSLSNGGIARVSENRNVGWRAPETYISQFYGTEGGYEFSVAKHFFATWDKERPGKVIMRDVSDELTPKSVTELLRRDFDGGIQEIADGAGFSESSPIQRADRLPESYRGLENGHNGTHHYLIDDFCKAAVSGCLSPTNIWAVARYNIPGLCAHKSALEGGTVISVPDLGNAPKEIKLLDAYDFSYNQGK